MQMLTLRVKLLLAFLAVGLVTLATGIIGFASLSSVVEAQRQKDEAALLNVEFLDKEIAHLRYRQKLGEFQNDPAVTEIKVEKDSHKCGFGQWYYSDRRTQAARMIPDLERPLQAVEAPHSQLHSYAQKIETLLKEGKRAEAVRTFENDAALSLAEIQKHFAEIRTLIKRHTEQLAAQTHKTVRWRQVITVLTTALSIALALIIGYLYANMFERLLRGISNNLSQGANTVTETSNQVANTSESLSSATQEQAAALQETAASVTELSSMIAKTAENSNASLDISIKSLQSAEQGKKVVDEMISGMQRIAESNQAVRNQIQASNQEFANIVALISEIDNKTRVINDIVFQTKLLSFNASVEAARAGEHGKGFAVVAEEVGNLAQMSGNAAKEISALLEGSIHRVNEIVKQSKTQVEVLANTSEERVRDGVAIAHRCGEVLDNLVSNVESVNQKTGEISNAAQEQANGISEINRAMTQLDQVTHQNAQHSDHTAAAAAALKDEASQLRTHVETLLTALDGTQRAS